MTAIELSLRHQPVSDLFETTADAERREQWRLAPAQMQAYADFLSKAANFYDAQAAVVNEKILNLNGTAASIRQVTDGVNAEMEKIKEDDAAKDENPTKVKA